jgi:N-carbamoyl-L-amino-acid hydrolase
MTAASERAMPHSIADHVREPRLLDLIERLAHFGARADGGVDRQALTQMEIDARRFLLGHARSLGCTAFQDRAGNLFFRCEGTDSGPPVMTGSHIDTQPAGGKLDGAYGVCAGLEVIAALRDSGRRTRRPVEVVVWANEEGCRFAPGSMGSAAFVDPARLPTFREARDARRATYGECVDLVHRQFTDVPMRDLQLVVYAFVETHIEQGPVLEQAQIPIGVVLGIQGVRWYRVRAVGQASHAGTTPLEYRRDALRALTDLAGRMYALAEQTAGLRLTIGMIDVVPGSINTIPGEASLTLDVRHPDEDALDRCTVMLARFCEAPRFGCDVGFEQSMGMPTTWFSAPVRTSIREAADGLGLASMDMMSGAFHDSVHLARHCPTGMIFVPSREGVSHNPTEYTERRHLVDGARVLAATVAGHAGLAASADVTERA